MELADATVLPSSSTLHNATANNLDAFKRELHDRSFDVGEDEEDEEEQDDDDPTMNNDGAHPLIAELREIGMFHFIEKYVPAPDNTTALDWITLLKAFGITLPEMPQDAEPISDAQLLRVLKIAISRALRARVPLSQYTTPSHAVSLIHRSSNILVLTGAGISTNCGIPDFRSKDTGLYSTLLKSGKYSDFLSDPQEMFDIHVFREFPNLFYDFAKEIYTYPDSEPEGQHAEGEGARKSKIKCSKTHKWIRKLETWNGGSQALGSNDNQPKQQELKQGPEAEGGSKGKGKLLRCYTQNIDTLEQTAGIQNVLYAHGSFATCSCLTCGTCFPGDTIKDAIQNQTVPLCPLCPSAPPSSRPSKRRKLDTHPNGHLRPSPSPSSSDDDDENDYGLSPYHNAPLLKPDITFFGQALSSSFDSTLLVDRAKVDLLIIIGTSLQVAPVSEILAHLPHSVPQILINRDPVPHVMDKVDIVMLGDCDEVVGWLDNELEKLRAREDEGKKDQWADAYDGPEPVLALPARPIPIPSHSLPPHPEPSLISINAATTTLQSGIVPAQDPQEQQEETVMSDSVENIWLFRGANTEHRWLKLAREALDQIDSDDAEEGDGEEDEQSSEDGEGGEEEEEEEVAGAHEVLGSTDAQDQAVG